MSFGCKSPQPPAPRRNRDHLVDGWMKLCERREGLLHNPRQPCIRQMPARVGDGRHVMHHVAELMMS